jgi:phage tail sheath gpL-like
VNSTAVAPAYVVASSTNGLITLTGSNTFVKGDKIKIKFGTTTTAATPAATYATCTLNVTQTP